MQQDISRDEIKFIESRIRDKIKMAKKTQTMQWTDFLDFRMKKIADKVLKECMYKAYQYFGGDEEADRVMLLIFPEVEQPASIRTEQLKEIVCAIRIILPKKQTPYEHRVYLSGMMKLGLKREKFGDIHVFEDGVEIILQKEIAEYCLHELSLLHRFEGAKFDLISVENLRKKEVKFEERNIVISSNRLDSFVSQCAGTSRTHAAEMIEAGDVLINMCVETKGTRRLQEGDILTIRRKGKFILEHFGKITKSGRIQVVMKQYKS